MFFILRANHPASGSRLLRHVRFSREKLMAEKAAVKKKLLARLDGRLKDAEKKIGKKSDSYYYTASEQGWKNFISLRRQNDKLAIKFVLHGLDKYSPRVAASLIRIWNHRYLTGGDFLGKAQRNVVVSRMMHVLRENNIPVEKFFTSFFAVQKELGEQSV